MKIYDKDDNTLLTVLETADAAHEVELMKSDLVRLSWVGNECVTIPAGAYIIPFDDDDVRYTIYEDYVPEETSNGFKYEPQFESPVMWLGYVPFTFKTKDAAGADVNKTDYPYVGRLSEILTQYVTLINAEFSKRWHEQYHEMFDEFHLEYYIGFDNTKTISVSFSDNDCLSALALICEAAECEYYFDWSTQKLLIGEKINDNPAGNDYIYVTGDGRHWLDLKIGDNVNEPSISRSKSPVYNRYIVLGSTRNNIRETENNHWIATGERLTLDTNTYPDSVIDLRRESPYTPSSAWKTGMDKVPAMTGIMVFDDIYPHRDLYIYDLHERKKYKTDENGYPTSERWSVWYFKLAYKDNGTWREYKLIGDTDASLSCQTLGEARYEVISSPDPLKKSYIIDLAWGDYFKTFDVQSGEPAITITQRYARVTYDGHDYYVGVREYEGRVMLTAFDERITNPPFTDGFEAFFEEARQFQPISVSDVDLSKAPSENRKDYRVDGLAPSIAFQVNDASGALSSPLGAREFELNYTTSKITFDASDDDPDQTEKELDGGYYEIIHTEEADGLIMPTTHEQGICPKAVYGTNPETIGDMLLMSNKVFLFNVQVDEGMANNARNELKTEAVKAVDQLAVDNNTYTFQCNPVTLESDISYSDRYKVGIRTRFVLGNGYEYFGRILSVKTKMDYTFCKEITVGNAVQKGRNDRLISELKKQSATLGTGGVGGIGSASVNPADIASIGRDLFLSKTYDDQTQYLVGFLGGLMVDGFLKSPEFSRGEWEMVKDEESGLLTKVHTGEGLGVYRDDEGGWHIELDEATIRKMLRTKELSSLKAFFGSEDYYNPEESVLAVQGNAEFSHHLSSTEFQSGFIGGKGWAIKRVEFTNALGEPETRYTLEIDNITVRNTLRVYEMIISQLRGENDNYIFAAMAEVHHYDPETGKVWLSTEGGKIYMPFRPGDYIMVQRYQPGNTAASGGDGYITKSYELVIIDCNAGGEVDENGDRLDWVLFKNFTTQMVDDSTDPRHDDPDYDGTYYTEEEIEQRVDPVMMTPEQLIKKGDTFCRIDNESDPERKGIIGITSVGPSTPYIDVMYGRKTDPEDFLKGRIGNLEGIKTKEFGWLQGFGAYLINLYSIGQFKNSQTGEAMESRIEATNERLRSVYREKGYDINENDNKVKNGFFQNGLDYWTPCNTTGTPLSEPAEMEYDENTDTWSMEHSDGSEAYMIDTGGDPMLLNGLQLEVQKTTNVELTTSEGVQVLHLNNAGIIQDFSDMTPNTAHKKLTVDDDEFDDPDTLKPEYDKETRGYWENIIRGEIEKAHPTWNTRQIEEELAKTSYQQRIDANIALWAVTNADREATLTEMEDENDKLYLGVRILPLTGGDLTVAFLASGETPGIGNSVTFDCWHDSNTAWDIKQQNDSPETQEEWYFPVDIETVTKQGRFLVSYTGECYIRFVVLQNNPIDENEHEYETIFEQNSRRILMQASKDQSEQASIVLQHDAIAQMVTDDRNNAETQLAKILGITINADGTYNFPTDWINTIGNYNYGSFNIQTKNRLDTLFAKWDDKGNLIGYSHHTQSADYIRNVIASTQYTSYPQWVKDILGLVNDINDFYKTWKKAAANGGLSGSSVTTLKNQWAEIFSSYENCKATVRNLSGDDLKGYELAVGIFLSQHTEQTVSNIGIEMGRFTNGEAVDKDNYDYKELNFTDIPELVEIMKQFTDSVVSQSADNNLAANVAAVTADFTQYQTDLDAATAGSYTGQVDFLNWVNDTSQSYVKVLAALSDATGQLIDYSMVVQTAQQISNTVARFEEENIELAVIGNWEAKDVQSSSIAGKAYDDIKVNSSSTILYKYLVPVTKYASVVLNDGYKVKFVYFDINKKVCTGNLNNSGWKGVTKDGNKVVETNISVKTAGGDLPSSMRYVAIVLKKDSGSMSTDNVADSGIMLTDNKIASASYVVQTANGITTTVTNNKTYAENALKTIFGDDFALDSTAGAKAAASWLVQSKDGIYGAAATFDDDGNILDRSALAVTIEGINTEVGKKTTVDALKNLIDSDVWHESGVASAYSSFKTQTNSRIASLVGKWNVDQDGNPTTLKSSAGAVLTGDFAGLFAASYDSERIEIADISSWEQGDYNGATKVASNNAIRTINLIPVNSGTVFFLNDGYKLKISRYNSSQTYISQETKTPDATSGRVVFTSSGVSFVRLAIVKDPAAAISTSGLSATGIYQSNTNEVTRGEMSVFVDNFGTSNAKIKADNIIFNFTNSSDWYWNNGGTGEKHIMKVDSTGLHVYGQIEAEQTNFSASNVSITGTIGDDTTGNIILNNAKKIRWKNSSGTAISMLTLDASNHFIVGEATAANSLNTYIRGTEIYFQVGAGNKNTRGGLFYIPEGETVPILSVSKLKIGDALLQWVSGKGLQVDKTFYSTLGVAALGSGSSSGGGGGADVTIEEFGVTSGKNLKLTISGQSATANLSSMFSEYVTSGNISTLTINGETWNPLGGSKTITIQGGISWDDLENASGHDIGKSGSTSSLLDNLYASNVTALALNTANVNYSDSTNLILCYGGGNVGIGVSSPSYKLDVVGQFRLRQSTSSASKLSFGCYADSQQPYIRFTDLNGDDTDIKMVTESGTTYAFYLGSHLRQTRIFGSNVRLYSRTASDVDQYTTAIATLYGGRVIAGGSDSTFTNNNKDCVFLVKGSACTAESDGSFMQVGKVRMVYDDSKSALKAIKKDGTSAYLYSNGNRVLTEVDAVTLDTNQSLTGVKTFNNGARFWSICVECGESQGVGVSDNERHGEINRYNGHLWLQYHAEKDIVMSYNSGSHVCIGTDPTTTTQRYKFYVSGDSYFTGELIARGGYTVIDSGNIGDYAMSTAGSDKINGDLIPKTTNDVSLGSSSKRWKNIFGTNGIFSATDTAIPSSAVSDYDPRVYVSGKGYFTGEIYSAGGWKVLNNKSVMNYCLGLHSYDSTPSGATIIDTSVNVNNIKAAGTYCCKSAASITGQPARGNYRLWHIVNSGTDSSSSQNAVQVALYTSNAKMYLRSYVSGTFGDWNEVATTGNAVTLSATQSISGAKTFTGGVTANALSISQGGTLSVYGSASTLAIKGESINNAATTLAIQGSGSTKDLTLCAGGGNVGVGGSASSSYKLYVNGKGYFTSVYIGDSSVYLEKRGVASNVYVLNIHAAGVYLNNNPFSGSDMRRKNILSHINDVSIENIADAPIFNFTWKTESDKMVHVGTSAQYWENILPNSVMDFGIMGLSLDYNAISVVSAVITARKVVNHEERIKALEAENERLRNEIEQLKAA